MTRLVAIALVALGAWWPTCSSAAPVAPGASGESAAETQAAVNESRAFRDGGAPRGLASFTANRCGPHQVATGPLCLDAYEASVWRVPNPTTANLSLVRKIRLGTASRADLTAGGATQLGAGSDDYAPCTLSGQNCADLFAVSLPSEVPSAFATWFQAQEACANAGKRLSTSAE